MILEVFSNLNDSDSKMVLLNSYSAEFPEVLTLKVQFLEQGTELSGGWDILL